jgi:hypothetical protein
MAENQQCCVSETCRIQDLSFFNGLFTTWKKPAMFRWNGRLGTCSSLSFYAYRAGHEFQTAGQEDLLQRYALGQESLQEYWS